MHNRTLKFAQYAMENRGCTPHSPAASQNQLERVKAICELATLASGNHCTIIIINNTDLFIFLYFFTCFHVSL